MGVAENGGRPHDRSRAACRTGTGCCYRLRPLPFDLVTWLLAQAPVALLPPRTLAAMPQMLTGMFGDTGPMPARMSLPLRIPSTDFMVEPPSPPRPMPSRSPELMP